VAAGGLVPVFTQAERDGLAVYDGLLVARMDIPAIELRAGAAWRTVWRGDTIAPYAQAAGQISFSGSVNAGAGAKVGNITFPVGRFSVAPRVVPGLANAPGGSQLLVPRSSSTTASGSEIYVYNAGSTAASVSGLVIDWHAMQMQQGQASG
ncbi:MAG TPA: hypothetical protein VFX60_13030, partial [Micromonospora sp.]|nr:hypothetical protein [Micromonospora sp.]